MAGIETLLQMCKDAIGVHPHVLIHTSDALRVVLHKAICDYFNVEYIRNHTMIPISSDLKIFVHTNKPFNRFGGGLMILFYTDISFPHRECVMPHLDGVMAEPALCMFYDDRVINGKEAVLRVFTKFMDGRHFGFRNEWRLQFDL
jgi:hypothetical protein